MTTSIAAKLPPTSLIICSRNRPDLLAETVGSIIAGDTLPDELIIIDQSDLPHAELARLHVEHGCVMRYVWSQSVGLSRANNLGIAAASHDLLVFTHDDVEVTPTWLQSLVQALVFAGARCVVTGQVRPGAIKTPGGFVPSTNADPNPAVYSGRLNKDVLYPLNMAMYRAAVTEVGGFDERLGPGTPFPGAEDSDFGFRLLEAGYRIVYAPDAAIYHRAWRTAAEYLPLRWSYGRARGAFYAKHVRLRDHYMLGRMVRDIGRVGWLPVRLRRDRRTAWGDVVLACGMLAGFVAWGLQEHGLRAVRRRRAAQASI